MVNVTDTARPGRQGRGPHATGGPVEVRAEEVEVVLRRQSRFGRKVVPVAIATGPGLRQIAKVAPSTDLVVGLGPRRDPSAALPPMNSPMSG